MNQKIQQARETALDILKPTEAQLEHGLELHKTSLVVESYGFAPRGPLDNNVLQAAVDANASGLELQDMAEDFILTGMLNDEADKKEFMDAWDASGVTCILQNAGEEGSTVKRLLKRLARFTWVSDSLREFCPKAVTPDDIVAAKEEERHCFYLSGNGVPVPFDFVSVEEELRFIRIFFQAGIRMMHLTYNRRNLIGDGCAEPANAGLSEFGRAVVKEMNRQGVIVDVAHSGLKTGYDAAKVSDKPMVISHSTCASLHQHIRAKTDEVIRAVVDTGGFMGVCCIPSFLGGSGDINAMLDHIDHMIKTFGADHVAIGTDVSYSPQPKGDRAAMPKSRSRWESFWPDDAFQDKYREPKMGESMAWTNWPMFTVGMVQRGHSDEDIQKVLGGNVIRVARACFPGE
ncbi:MAG: membrane dipeptidase [Planctomycetota bacterium]|jgi:membrane dipeptidase|nr:membrane dipeptidase [Planctomycetota bacterium]